MRIIGIKKTFAAMQVKWHDKNTKNGNGLALTVDGNYCDGDELVCMKTNRLLSIGGVEDDGKDITDISSIPLLKQAIEQQSAIYYIDIGLEDDRKPLNWMLRFSQGVGGDRYIKYNSDLGHTSGLPTYCAKYVLEVKGSCYHKTLLGRFPFKGLPYEILCKDSENPFKVLLLRLIEGAKKHNRALVVIAGKKILSQLFSDYLKEIKELIISDVSLHIIDSAICSERDNDVIEYIKSLGFDLADYRFSSTGENREGVAVLSSPQFRGERVRVNVKNVIVPEFL